MERLYVACADARTIEVLDLDDAGALHRHASVTTPGPDGAGMSMPLALSADRTRLYAAIRTEPCQVASYAVDADGGLALRGVTLLPASMCHISLAGRFLLSASYPASLITSHRLDADGVAQAPPVQTIETPANAHCILPDPAGRFVYVPCLGGDAILHLRFDPVSGMLTPQGQGRVATRPGAGPRHMRFAADGRTAYVLNEHDASLDTYAVDPETGALCLRQTVNTLPRALPGRAAAADLHLTPDGRFLYASERTTNTLSAWRIAPETGQLTLLGHTDSEPSPRGFAISPEGRYLLCAGQTSHRVGVYAIDPETGALTPIGGLAVAANPNWITFLHG